MVSFQNKLVAIGNLYLIYIFAMNILPNKLKAISSIETIYLIYMFNFFKTKINFAHKISHFKNKFIHHPIGKPNKSKNMICKFGKVTSWIFALYLLLRHQNFNRFVNKTSKMSKIKNQQKLQLSNYKNIFWIIALIVIITPIVLLQEDISK